MMKNGNEDRPLPDGWRWVRIGDITEPIEKINPQDEPDKEFTYLDISGIDNSRHVVREPKVYYGAEAPSRARQAVRAGDVLFSTVRTYLKNIAQVPPKYDGQVASTGFSILRGRQEVDNRYLFYYSLTDTFLTSLSKLQRGTSYPAVRDSDVREQMLPLPPLAEQECIVAEIEKQFTRLDQAVAALRRLQSHLARYKASVLKAACEGRLVLQDPNDEPAAHLLSRILAERRAQWQATNPGKKYREPQGVDTAGLPELPEGWSWVSMLTLIIDGPTNGLYLPKSRYGKGIPILRIDDYQNGSSRPSHKLRKVDAGQGDIEKYRLRKHDLIINRVNSPSHLGKCLVVEERNLPSIFESNMMRMALSKNINPYFVEFYLRSAEGRARLISNAKWAVNQASINQGDVVRTPIPLPPLAEQERIVAEVERRLSVIAAGERAIQTSLARAERLRQSILHQAFTGRLVPNSPK